MRAQARRITHEEEEESAFVSMTDMTVGFLFIMMILLAFFASQIQENDSVPLVTHETVLDERDYWKQLAETRIETVFRLENDIVLLSDQNDILISEKNNLIDKRDYWKTIVDNQANIITQLEAKVSLLNEENIFIKIQRDKLDFELGNANIRIDNLILEKQENIDQIAELEIIISQLQQQIFNRDERITQLQLELSILKQIDPLEEYLAKITTVRNEILIRLRDAIQSDFPLLKVNLSNDALRFQGEGLFASGRANLTSRRREIVGKLAQRLDEVLLCFTVGKRTKFSTDCNPEFIMVETVQIEGHTDNIGTDIVNRNLSTARANNTFFAMTNAAPLIMDLQNFKLQPVLSVSAYGPDRPVTTNETQAGRATNRRIDLRFIMVTPKDTSGIATIRKALEALSDDAQ